MTTLRILLALAAATFVHAQSRTLDIYWIDVEGGASTLIVTPSGQSMLVDAGNPGNNDRDSQRAFEAAKAAGLKKIEILVTTRDQERIALAKTVVEVAKADVEAALARLDEARADFASYRAEAERWNQVIKAAGIRLE